MFHVRTHIAEIKFRISWLLSLAESPRVTQTEKLFRYRRIPGVPELGCVCISERGQR